MHVLLLLCYCFRSNLLLFHGEPKALEKKAFESCQVSDAVCACIIKLNYFIPLLRWCPVHSYRNAQGCTERKSKTKT